MTKTRAKGKATEAGSGSDSVAPPESAGADAGAGPEATVIAYLRAHPDFFARNPQALTHLQVAHAAGGAVSLIEHQVKVLRAQLDIERGRLSQLIARARDYESFSTRLHALVLQLIAAPDLERVRAALQEALRREFNAEAVTLKLFPLDPTDGAVDPDPLTAAFRDFLGREHALCGPLQDAQNQVLFGDLGSQVHCAALVPIRGDGRSGVLAIGAADPDRFKPEMGTDLLDRLGEIVSQKLRVLPADGPSPARAPEPVPAVDPEPTPPRRKRAKRTVKE